MAWRLSACLAAVIFLATPAGGEPGDPLRIVWDKVPIRLELRTGLERIVHFPGPVTLGVPASVSARLRAQSLDGTVYLRAEVPFAPVRVQVRSLNGGPVYLLDISATDTGAPGPSVRVELAHGLQGRAALDSPYTASPPGYVALTRFAARKLYAPVRLAADRPGLARVPVAREPVALVRGGGVVATPLIAWQAGNLYVTAVRLTNRTAHSYTLDARALRGAWLAATFQHNVLQGVASDASTTVVYLISRRPFAVLVPSAPDAHG